MEFADKLFRFDPLSISNGDNMSASQAQRGIRSLPAQDFDPEKIDQNSDAENQKSSTTKEYKKYTIQAGDSLSKIAKKYGISLASLLQMNPQIKNANLIFPGMVLNIGQIETKEEKDEMVEKPFEISGSVGRGGSNNKKDVITVQNLLNNLGYNLVVDGIFGNNTLSAIYSFQREYVGFLNPDGIIDVGGKTWNTLISNPKKIPTKDKEPQDNSLKGLAQQFNVEPAVILAIKDVESGGSGFLKDGRPKILFEGHIFWQELKNVNINPNNHVSGNENILYPKWTKRHYVGGSGEYDRLEKAKAIHETAALKSASWGSFQIMGFNHRLAGFDNVQAMVNALHQDANQLAALFSFLDSTGLLRHVRGNNKNWAAFAKGYNGSEYKQNNYDIRLLNAYLRHLSNGANN